VSPGLATFDANVVPTASQGQPYRGEKGPQVQQTQSGGEMGRATPPPRPSVADMSEEEFEKIMKEHEVLRKFCVLGAWSRTDSVQARNTKRSSDTSSNSRRKYTSSRTLLRTSGYHFLEHHGTIANTQLGSTDWMD
jgi:hypothetical protein